MLEKSVDGPSSKGQFGWEQIGRPELAIPVIVRNNGIRYCPVRIVEQEIIKKYDSLPQSVFQCITLKSFYLTALEAKLLNEINYNHCNQRYGEAFFTVKDVIISAEDVKDLSRYLNISLEIFTNGVSKLGPRLGIIEMTTSPENGAMMVPFTTKVRNDGLARFVPYNIVKHFVRTSSASVFTPPNDWDIMYLKMLSAYCNQDLQQLITKDGQLILLDGLISITSNTQLSYTVCTEVAKRAMNNIH